MSRIPISVNNVAHYQQVIRKQSEESPCHFLLCIHEITYSKEKRNAKIRTDATFISYERIRTFLWRLFRSSQRYYLCRYIYPHRCFSTVKATIDVNNEQAEQEQEGREDDDEEGDYDEEND